MRLRTFWLECPHTKAEGREGGHLGVAIHVARCREDWQQELCGACPPRSPCS